MNISVPCLIEFQLYSGYFAFGLTTLDKTGWKPLPLEQMGHCCVLIQDIIASLS